MQFHKNAHKHGELYQAKSYYKNQIFMNIHAYRNMRISKTHESKRMNHEELKPQYRI